MSYARWAPDSDVYVYYNGQGWETHLVADGLVSTEDATLEELRSRLLEYKSRGSLVPDRVFERIDRELLS